jgi:hypothetical protein
MTADAAFSVARCRADRDGRCTCGIFLYPALSLVGSTQCALAADRPQSVVHAARAVRWMGRRLLYFAAYDANQAI